MQITGIIPIIFHVSQNKSNNSMNFFLIDQVIIVQTEGPLIYLPSVLSVKNYLWDDRIVQKPLQIAISICCRSDVVNQRRGSHVDHRGNVNNLSCISETYINAIFCFNWSSSCCTGLV